MVKEDHEKSKCFNETLRLSIPSWLDCSPNESVVQDLQSSCNELEADLNVKTTRHADLSSDQQVDTCNFAVGGLTNYNGNYNTSTACEGCKKEFPASKERDGKICFSNELKVQCKKLRRIQTIR